MRAPPVSARSEHISLESEPANGKRTVRGPHRVYARLRWRNVLRGIEAQFELADDHFLQVRYLQPRRHARQYTVDLRFCAAQPRRSRHVAWLLLIATLALAGASTAATWMLMRGSVPESPNLFAGITIGLAAAAAALAALFLQRTTESLEFTSLHGQVPLVRLTGGLGSGHKAKAFCIELIKSINLAHAKLDTTAQTYLRDEMREHQRLRRVGALSEGEYETCKQRILAAHAP